MAGLQTQGTVLSGTFSGFDNALNDDGDQEVMSWSAGWYDRHVRVEPEMFARKMTLTSSVTFKEQEQDTNEETFQCYILYKITK